MKNYLKGFFKSFGIVPIVLGITVFVLLAYIGVSKNFVTGSMATVVGGLALAVPALLVVLGVTGLKNTKIGFTDFTRVVVVISSLISAIIIVVGGYSTKYTIAYFCVFGLGLVEMIFRCIFCREYNENSTFKTYFGTLAAKYNPLIILVAGAVLAAVLGFLFKYNVISDMSFIPSMKTLKYVFVGGMAAVVLIVLLSAIDSETDVTLLDFAMAVGFVTGSYSFLFATLGLVSSTVSFMLIGVAAICGVSLILRGVFYNKPEVKTLGSHKVREYFKNTYTKYDAVLPLALGVLAILFVALGASQAYGDKYSVLNRFFGAVGFDASNVMIFNVFAIVLGLVGVVVACIKISKVKSQNTILTDAALVMLLFTSTAILLYCVLGIILNDNFTAETGNIVLLVVYAIIFVFAAVVQFLRLKSYDQMAEVAAAAEKAEEEKKEEEAVQNAIEEANAEEPAEEVKEEAPAEEEKNDPFALTDEDEALFNAYYGAEEKKEEAPAKFVVTREMVINYVAGMTGEEHPVATVVKERAADNRPDSLNADVCNMALLYGQDGGLSLLVRMDEENGAVIVQAYTATASKFAGTNDYYKVALDDKFESEDEVKNIMEASYAYILSKYFQVDDEGNFVALVDENTDDAPELDAIEDAEAPVVAPVVEEAPAEEVVEEAEEEEAEEEEEEVEEEADELEDDGEPVEEVLPVHAEAAIQVNDFQVLDENGEVRKIKRKFITKMMYAPYETKEFYNEIKNYLCMYRAKGRPSSRCESFRYKGLVAKVALGGKSIKVFLAIDPSFIEENPKYHLKDVSEKKQYVEVPVMMKVRSARGLKYFKELVDYMFAQRGVKPKRNFEEVNYLPTLIPNGEAILATLGMSTYYLQNMMNVNGIPEEMPDNLIDYVPAIPGEPLEEEETEAVVYLDTLCNHFQEGDEVTIDVLKSLHVVTKGNVIRVKARGTLDRKLTIYAEYFDEDALKMLMCTNCTVIKIIR